MSDQPVRRKFVAKRKEEEFDVVLQDGNERSYLMREIDGVQRGLYNQSVSDRFNRTANGMMGGIKNFKGWESSLLKLCVFDPETEKLVPEKEIESWSSSCLEEIFKWAEQFNAVNKTAEADAKNDSSGSTSSGTP